MRVIWMPRMIFFITIYLFFLIYVVSSLFFFQARRDLGGFPSLPLLSGRKKANFGGPIPRPAVKAHLSAPCWRSARLSWMSPGRPCCSWAAGLGRQSGEQGRREITCLVLQTKWTSRQCQRLSEQKVPLPGFIPAGLGHTARINPWALTSLPALQLRACPAVNPGVCSDFKPRKICSRGRKEFPRCNFWRMGV